MTTALIQKLLTAIVVLTSIYATFIFTTYYDLVRPISKSLWNLIPGIILFGFGIAFTIALNQPDLIFIKLLPLKSGFAKGILGTSVFPLIGASTRTLAIIASLSLFIDKMWLNWQSKRLWFLVRMSSVICMIIVAGNTLFKVIFTDQATMIRGIKKLNLVGTWTASALGTILLLTTVMAIPHIFNNNKRAHK